MAASRNNSAIQKRAHIAFADEEPAEDDSVSVPNGVATTSSTSSVLQTDRFGFLREPGNGDYPSETRIPVSVLRAREEKWRLMFTDWEFWMKKKFDKVKSRCRKGIPTSMRARAWQRLCRSQMMMEDNPGKYQSYLSRQHDPRWADDIEKDLHRQFPHHELFLQRGGPGQTDLQRVLLAYTHHNPEVGYCQAMGPVAAVLLMHMPEEQAFWTLACICDQYLPGYYSSGLDAVLIDGDTLFGLLKKVFPATHRLLRKQKIDPALYMVDWFMCIFSRSLPWPTVLRVWDMFFCEGVKVLFRVALVLFKLSVSTRSQLDKCPSMYETLEKLRKIPPSLLGDESIVKESLKLPINEKDMGREHSKAVAARKSTAKRAE